MAALVFACFAEDAPAGRRARLLARSIRAFAGRFAESPIWIMVPRATPLPEDVSDGMKAAAAEVVPCDISSAVAAFPFGAKVIAAGAAEARAAGGGTLIWMDSGALVLREPSELHLPSGKTFAARPVDLALIGSRLSDPVTPFWDLIYRACAVPEESLFPMESSVDEVSIRPYFNAGLLAVDPERGVLGQWATTFQRVYQGPRLVELYQADSRYSVFAHQAVLAGVVLSSLDREEIGELAPLANYPLHLHDRYPRARRPRSLDEVTVCRYEEFFENPVWETAIGLGAPLRSWLRRELGLIVGARG
jgi:hypothetical protein